MQNINVMLKNVYCKFIYFFQFLFFMDLKWKYNVFFCCNNRICNVDIKIFVFDLEVIKGSKQEINKKMFDFMLSVK